MRDGLVPGVSFPNFLGDRRLTYGGPLPFEGAEGKIGGLIAAEQGIGRGGAHGEAGQSDLKPGINIRYIDNTRKKKNIEFGFYGI